MFSANAPTLKEKERQIHTMEELTWLQSQEDKKRWREEARKKQTIDLRNKKLKIDKSGNITEKKDFTTLPYEEKQVLRERARKLLEKKVGKKLKFIPIKEHDPYVEGVTYVKNGVCHMCGCDMLYQRGVKLLIPSIKTGEFRICSVCLGRVYKATMAYKNNDVTDQVIRTEMGVRDCKISNMTVRVPKDKKEKRNTYEIIGELAKEVETELGIPEDFTL